MRKFILANFLLVFSFLIPSISYSMERDYSYTGCPYVDGRDDDELEEEDGSYYCECNSDEACYKCFKSLCWRLFPYKHEKELDVNLIPSIRYFDDWRGCYSSYDCPCGRYPAIYSGYLHFRYKGDYPFLKRQLAYSKKYPQNQSYWPETSSKAEKISDIAALLFRSLVDSTALNQVRENPCLQEKFITDSWFFKKLGYCLPISLSASCFRFTDFYQVCRDLMEFSRETFSKDECFLIEENLDKILDKLCEMFLEVYQESLSLHPTDEIHSELKFIELLYGYNQKQNRPECRYNSACSWNKEIIKNTGTQAFKRCLKSLKKNKPSMNTPDHLPDWLVSDYFLLEGSRYNDLFLHAEALSCLNKAIHKDPFNVDAYRERMHAHFEMGNLDLGTV